MSNSRQRTEISDIPGQVLDPLDPSSTLPPLDPRQTMLVAQAQKGLREGEGKGKKQSHVRSERWVREHARLYLSGRGVDQNNLAGVYRVRRCCTKQSLRPTLTNHEAASRLRRLKQPGQGTCFAPVCKLGLAN
ncbi:hypothetical protein V2G26_010253 [Clonostachys chloroleuca]